MNSNKPRNRWNYVSLWITFSFYWLVSVLSSDIESLFGYEGSDGVYTISATFFLIIIICMVTERGRWQIWKRMIYIPLCFLFHVLLTIPSSAALGILKFSPDHVRTHAEQRAVFLLASIPILVYSMRQSRLFVGKAICSEKEIDA